MMVADCGLDRAVAVLTVLVDRRRSLGEDHTPMIAQLHQRLLELIPGGARKTSLTHQAKALVAKFRPLDVAGKTRRCTPPPVTVKNSRRIEHGTTLDRGTAPRIPVRLPAEPLPPAQTLAACISTLGAWGYKSPANMR